MRAAIMGLLLAGLVAMIVDLWRPPMRRMWRDWRQPSPEPAEGSNPLGSDQG